MGTVMPPELSIEGNVLGIYFADALTDLQVQILDARGNLLYVEMISGACGETYSIPLVGLAPGEYRVVLTHKFGWISGMFTVE